MNNLLNTLEIFYHVVRGQSFTGAAIELNVSKAYVSQQISDLETELGVKLILRSTRRLKLTDAGEILLSSCERIIQEKKLALTRIEEIKTKPVGSLKISAPPSLCSSVLAKIIPDFLKLYPDIQISLDASSTLKNMFSDNVDLAIRITNEPDPNCIAKQIAQFHFVICATPGYIKKHDAINTPHDLMKHDCLIYSAQPQANIWRFAQDTVINVTGGLRSTNVAVISNALLAGNGVARLPEYVIADELTSTSIISLLEAYQAQPMSIYALYPSTLLTSPKIKCFIDFLMAHKIWHQTPDL